MGGGGGGVEGLLALGDVLALGVGDHGGVVVDQTEGLGGGHSAVIVVDLDLTDGHILSALDGGEEVDADVAGGLSADIHLHTLGLGYGQILQMLDLGEGLAVIGDGDLQLGGEGTAVVEDVACGVEIHAVEGQSLAQINIHVGSLTVRGSPAVAVAVGQADVVLQAGDVPAVGAHGGGGGDHGVVHQIHGGVGLTGDGLVVIEALGQSDEHSVACGQLEGELLTVQGQRLERAVGTADLGDRLDGGIKGQLHVLSGGVVVVDHHEVVSSRLLVAEEGQDHGIVLVSLHEEVGGHGGLTVGIGAVEPHLQGVALDQSLTDGEDLVVDGLDGVVVGVGGTVGGDDAVSEGLGAVHGGEPREEGELLVAEGQRGVHFVADLAVGGTAEGGGLGDGLDVHTRLHVILQTHLVAGAGVLEEACTIHSARLQGEGVAVKHEIVLRIACGSSQTAPVLHLRLIDGGGAVSTVGEEVEVHVGIGSGLLQSDVGIQKGVGVQGLVQNVEAVGAGNVLVLGHGLGDLRLGLTRQRAAEVAVVDGHTDAVLGAQLQHLGLIFGSGQGLLACAQHPVHACLRDELVLLVGDIVGCGRPEDGDHDIVVEGILLVHHLDRAGYGLIQRRAGGGDGGLTQLFGDDLAVCIHGGYRGIGALVGHGVGVLGAQKNGLDGIGLVHVQLQRGTIQCQSRLGHAEHGQLTQLGQRAVTTRGGIALNDVEADELGLGGGEGVGLDLLIVDGHACILGHLGVGLAVSRDLDLVLGGELAVGEQGYGGDVGFGGQLQRDGHGLGVIHLTVVGLAGPAAVADDAVGEQYLRPALRGHFVAVLGACPLVGAGRDGHLGVLGDQLGSVRGVLRHALLGGKGRDHGGIAHGGNGADGHQNGQCQSHGTAGKKFHACFLLRICAL